MNLKTLNPYYLVSKTCQTKDRQLSSATSFLSDNTSFPAKSGHHQGTQSKVFNIQKLWILLRKGNNWRTKTGFQQQQNCKTMYPKLIYNMRSRNNDRDLQKGPYPFLMRYPIYVMNNMSSPNSNTNLWNDIFIL